MCMPPHHIVTIAWAMVPEGACLASSGQISCANSWALLLVVVVVVLWGGEEEVG